jgi:hypothetical protein
VISDQIYDVIRDHQGAGDRILAIVMNRRLMFDLIDEGTFAGGYRTYSAGRPDSFCVFGYEVLIMHEIPDGEFIVVCEERVTTVNFKVWYDFNKDLKERVIGTFTVPKDMIL